jgi:hypothetical protein
MYGVAWVPGIGSGTATVTVTPPSGSGSAFMVSGPVGDQTLTFITAVATP